MANGMKYPKELPAAVQVTVGSEPRWVYDNLAELAIQPYFGFWGVDEILKTALGSGPQLCVVRTLESYPTLPEAKAYIEGFMAGRKDRKKIK
jgi:hypothetical protein